MYNKPLLVAKGSMKIKGTKQKLARLRTFNLVMAGLHAVQAIIIAIISSDFSLPVKASYLDFDQSTQTLFIQSTELFEVQIAWLIVVFLALSSLAHLTISTIYKDKYESDLKKGINRLRWYEYSLSASVMIVAIAMLVGIYDAGSLFMLFSLVAVMNLTGLIMEVHNQKSKKVDWLSFNVGTFAGLVPWVVIAFYFWTTNTYGAGEIPTFVYWIYATIFAFFNAFAVNMILQYKKIGKWHDYLYGEKAYIVLSLVAKSALAWQVYAGTLQPA